MHAEELAKTIDHTLLQPDATSRDIDLSASTLDALLDQLDWFLAS